MMGPLRPRKTSRMKRSARLVDVVQIIVSEGRGIRQIYVEKSENRNPNENHISWRTEERLVGLL